MTTRAKTAECRRCGALEHFLRFLGHRIVVQRPCPKLGARPVVVGIPEAA